MRRSWMAGFGSKLLWNCVSGGPKMSCETGPDLWPVRPRPLRGEVFTGWLARIAQGHGVQPRFFFAHLRSRFRLPSDRDLDTDPSYELLAEVSRRTAIRYAGLVLMTLRWHVHPWYAREARNHPAFGFCSLCWRTDTVPYVRRAWRLPWMACQQHEVPLAWHCPRCKRWASVEALPAIPPISQCAECEL